MKLKLLVMVVAIFCLTNSALAQGCGPIVYDPADRDQIKQLFASHVSPLIGRAIGYAELGAGSPPHVQIGLLTARVALEQEAQAIIAEIGSIAANPPATLSQSGQAFVATILNLNRIGLVGITLLGQTQAEAELNSRTARGALVSALGKMWRCF